MSTYGQFCPVAKAMEVLDERWTLLVVRELLAGSSHFNELRRGVPRMSPALLSKRLRTLERAGVLRRTERAGRTSYSLTESGRELHGIVEALGVWGVRWVGQLGAEDLDPHLLLWDMKRTVPVAAWPRSRTVLAIEFDDVDARSARWWMVVVGDEVDVCDYDPGFEVTATLRTGLRPLTRLWRGDLDWAQLLASGDCAVDGPTAVRRDLPRWLGRSTLAEVPRPVAAAG
ncbi:MAG: transcriptional regulator [Nocardioides sp.]|nr:transcriptional regulator [Nocardioides sp.]